MLMAMTRSTGRAGQRGLSLVELMVGIAVGMFVVAAAATLVATQLTDNRRLLLEVQLQQDLRATTDIITRDLRRAGALSRLSDAANFVWSPAAPNFVQNLMLDIATGANSVLFENGRVPGDTGEYGYRLRQIGGVGVIESKLGDQGWQALTDSAVVDVRAFSVTPLLEPPIAVPCPKLCPDGTEACWPRISVRRYVIDITGRSVGDLAIRRSLQSVARTRADQVTTDPANAPGFCPA